MESIFTLEGLGALATLSFLEIILGVDNVIFISIVANRLPIPSRSNAWRIGLILALVVRVLMLFTITLMMKFNNSLITIQGFDFSLRDIILLGGGLFLVYKSTLEINRQMEPNNILMNQKNETKMLSVILQIVFIDFIFSFDSILTAVGICNIVLIMIAAVVISMVIMMIFLGAISQFIRQNHSIETLALAFLILIGFILVLEAFKYNIPKGYIYFAVGFAFAIELLNMRKRKKKEFEPEIGFDQ
jgi:predicted tellurium resistance membrane protein TerC